MSDRIVLRGLRAWGHHGVFDFERRDGQEFIVDVALEVDTSAAANSDDLADTVDYSNLADRLVAVLTGEPANLLEKLAQQLADACLSDERVAATTVTLHKPQAPIQHNFTDVSVTIRRIRTDVETPGLGPFADGALS